MLWHHRVAVYVRVLDDEITAERDELPVRTKLPTNMRSVMVGVENHHYALRASSGIPDLLDYLGRGGVANQ
jgi:hypothetical protein